MSMMTQPSNAVLKAFEILELFRDQPYLTPSECAAQLNMPRTTAHRMLVTLRHAGMLEATPDGRYSMAMQMFELGSWAPQVKRLNDVATRHLLLLREMTGLVVHLAVRDRNSLLYLMKAHRTVDGLPTGIGRRGPLHATGLGKALLAAMPEEEARAIFEQTGRPFTPYTHRTWESLSASLAEIRRTGFSYDIEERKLGVCCLATAIRDAEGTAIAALSVVGPTHPYKDKLADFRAPLARAASAIARDFVRRPADVAS